MSLKIDKMKGYRRFAFEYHPYIAKLVERIEVIYIPSICDNERL